MLGARTIIALASGVLVVFHVLGVLFALAVWMWVPGSRRVADDVGSLVVAVVTCAYACAVAYELVRRREWGRRWFTRLFTIELALGICLMELALHPDQARVPRPMLIAAAVVCAVFFVAKQWLRRRLASPTVRAEFPSDEG